LRNAVERAVLLSDQEQLQVGDLMLDRSPRGQGSERFEPSAGSIDLQRLERSAVETALQRTGFVQKEAALLLGVSRRKLNYMIQKLGLTHPSWRRNRAAPTDDGE
jgi:two-component system response regulator AtoC